MSLRIEIWTGVDSIKVSIKVSKARDYLLDMKPVKREQVYMSVTDQDGAWFTGTDYARSLAWLRERGNKFVLRDSNTLQELYACEDIVQMYYELGHLRPREGETTVREYKDGRLFDKWSKEHIELAVSAYRGLK